MHPIATQLFPESSFRIEISRFQVNVSKKSSAVGAAKVFFPISDLLPQLRLRNPFLLAYFKLFYGFD